MRILLFFFFYSIPIILFSQNSNELKYSGKDTYYVETYGLEEVNTIDYIKLILQDTNNVVLLDKYGSFLINSLFKEHYRFFDGEEPLCEFRLKTLQSEFNSNRPFGYNYQINQSFPDYFFKNLDGEFYKQIIDSLDSKDLSSFVKTADSIDKITLHNVFVKRFYLSRVDSLLLNNMIFGIPFDQQAFLNIGWDKNFYFLFSDYNLKNGIETFVNTHVNSNHNVILFLPIKGDRKKTLVNVNNKIKGARKIALFTSLKSSILPSKIKFSSECIINPNSYSKINFILLKQLDICY